MPHSESPTSMRLQRYLARAGVASRRLAEELIRAGRVRVNRQRAILGMTVSEDAVVTVDGERVTAVQQRSVLLVHKPVGMMTTLHDPEGRLTIAQFIPKGLHLHPVGRLDYHTSGLLVLTNDGALTQLLTHPRYGVDKTYRVSVRSRLGPAELVALQRGMRLDDGPTIPAKLRVVSRRREGTTFDLTIHEGRNRQIRRMLEELGHPVQTLTRLIFGPFRLGNLAPGELREPTAAEWTDIERILSGFHEEGGDG